MRTRQSIDSVGGHVSSQPDKHEERKSLNEKTIILCNPICDRTNLSFLCENAILHNLNSHILSLSHPLFSSSLSFFSSSSSSQLTETCLLTGYTIFIWVMLGVVEYCWNTISDWIIQIIQYSTESLLNGWFFHILIYITIWRIWNEQLMYQACIISLHSVSALSAISALLKFIKLVQHY